MKIDFDADSKALYFYFRDIQEGEVEETKEIGDGIYLDINKNNEPLGIEFLNIGKTLAPYDFNNLSRFLLTLKAFYSIYEVASLLNIDSETIRRKIKKGEIKAVKIGGSAGYRIAESELKRFCSNKAA